MFILLLYVHLINDYQMFQKKKKKKFSYKFNLF